MKGFCISFLIIAIIVLSVAGICLVPSTPKTEYLRIHVRADSNDDCDQAVKLLVKDAVVEYLTPFIAECDTKKKAENMLKDRLGGIEEVAREVLTEKGFTYGCKASIKNEKFPTRKYGALSLESGFYDALILELGSGKGDNWWCVVYPPLCFTGEKGVGYEYRSKIKEIIDEFYEKKGEK
jgi:stage II sporulation protein R